MRIPPIKFENTSDYTAKNDDMPKQRGKSSNRTAALLTASLISLAAMGKPLVKDYNADNYSTNARATYPSGRSRVKEHKIPLTEEEIIHKACIGILVFAFLFPMLFGGSAGTERKHPDEE